MSENATTSAAGEEVKKRYSAFDADLRYQALNVRLFIRLLNWVKPYRSTFLVSCGLILISAALGVLIPIVTGRVVVDTILIPDPRSLTTPDYGLIDANQWIVEMFSVHPLIGACVLYLLLTLGAAISMYAHRVTLSASVLRALRDLRIDLFDKLEHKPASFYDHVAIGRVMTRVTNDIENLFELLTGFGMLAGEFVPFFLAMFLMFAISPELTAVVLIAAPIVAVATFVFRKVMRDIYRLVRNSVSELNQYMQENLVGIDVVQLSGREPINKEEYRNRNQANRQHQYRAINLELVYGSFNQSLASIATGAVIWYGGGEVVQNELTLGSMILFTQFIGMLINPIVTLGDQLNALFRTMASGERIFQALDWEERIYEPSQPADLPYRVQGEIEFKNVHFGYYDDDPVLKNVSFQVQPGKKLAIVGPTGSGKSTVIRLLARFYDIDDDMIYLDGVDVNRVTTDDLRSRIGIVLQDFHIFSGSVLDNITLSDPAISTEKAIEAARMVRADDFIQELPEGYDTYLSERGQNLSQGERQLLAFARVLARDPEILVLDEATASIDTATELVIQDALHRLLEGRTAIVIAHRLQTIQECDAVLVLHHGVVEEYGTHDQLIDQKGIYYRLHELQFQDSSLADESHKEIR